MNTVATAAAPRRRPAWRNITALPSPSGEESPPAPSPQADEVFTVGSGTGGTSPDVEAGVHRVVLTDVVKETGENPFEPGEQRTVFIFTFALPGAIEDGTWRYYTGVSAKSQKLTTVLTALKVSGTSFKKSELVGREAQALIELTERGYTRIANLFPA